MENAGSYMKDFAIAVVRGAGGGRGEARMFST